MSKKRHLFPELGERKKRHNPDSIIARNKRREEERTGVAKSKGPTNRAERDYVVDINLRYWPNKGKIVRLVIEAFPNRTIYNINNNDPFEQFVARRKDVVPAKNPLRRANTPWTSGDYRVLSIVSRPKNVEGPVEACRPSRVAMILRRSVNEVIPKLEEALGKAGTLRRAQELGLF